MPFLTVIIEEKTEKVYFEDTPILGELLTEHGYLIPHPCGGKGSCKKCEVLVNGKTELSCQYTLSTDTVVVLPDEKKIYAADIKSNTAQITENVCLCLDIGTTTLALSLVSLDQKAVVYTATSNNPQCAFGADVISRIDYCMNNGVQRLHDVLTDEIQNMISSTLSAFNLTCVDTMYVAGNTTMLHLFFGVDCSSMGVSPYTPHFLDERRVSADTLSLNGIKNIVSIACVAAFVGADIVAGVDYVGTAENKKYRILLDLGTNAEIALFNSDKLLSTAAAAGPCFEGANISCGMTATNGAICSYASGGAVTVIGGGEAKGLCATGLIDVIAEGIKWGHIDESGYLECDPLPISGNINLIGADVREFQLAKSAIRAAMECLIQNADVSSADIDEIYIAGGFSGGLNIKNACFVGLIPQEFAEKVRIINNSSLLGTVKFALSGGALTTQFLHTEYVDLSADALFSDLFMKYMSF